MDVLCKVLVSILVRKQLLEPYFAVMVQSTRSSDTTHVVARTSWLEHPHWCKIKGSGVSASMESKEAVARGQPQTCIRSCLHWSEKVVTRLCWLEGEPKRCTSLGR